MPKSSLTRTRMGADLEFVLILPPSAHLSCIFPLFFTLGAQHFSAGKAEICLERGKLGRRTAWSRRKCPSSRVRSPWLHP